MNKNKLLGKLTTICLCAALTALPAAALAETDPATVTHWLNEQQYAEQRMIESDADEQVDPLLPMQDEAFAVNLFADELALEKAIKSAKGVTATLEETERTYITYRQGDARWGFPSSIEKKACVISSLAMMIWNVGRYEANPRTVYNATRSTGSNAARLEEEFKIDFVAAIPNTSEYFESFDALSGKTYIMSPSKNAKAAIKEAIDRNPEGVLVYFTRGDDAHAVVAVSYEGDEIIYCDPGRSKGSMIPFSQTWCRSHHKMSYANVCYLMAVDLS